jgi:hypothetical protein
MTEPSDENPRENDKKRRTLLEILKERKKKAHISDVRNMEDLYGCPNSAELSEIKLYKDTEVLDYE